MLRAPVFRSRFVKGPESFRLSVAAVVARVVGLRNRVRGWGWYEAVAELGVECGCDCDVEGAGTDLPTKCCCCCCCCCVSNLCCWRCVVIGCWRNVTVVDFAILFWECASSDDVEVEAVFIQCSPGLWLPEVVIIFKMLPTGAEERDVIDVTTLALQAVDAFVILCSASLILVFTCDTGGANCCSAELFTTFGDTGIVLNAPPPVGWNPDIPIGFTGEWYGYDRTPTDPLFSPAPWWNLEPASILPDGNLSTTNNNFVNTGKCAVLSTILHYKFFSILILVPKYVLIFCKFIHIIISTWWYNVVTNVKLLHNNLMLHKTRVH